MADNSQTKPSAAPETVSVTIDGKQLKVPKGTNLIEAAKIAGIEIPHYCYHKNLSVAGNCRMCQVQVKGAPKLDIACNTAVREGMEVSTHETSKVVADAQAATLEFILINHPLDCTVCDQAGQCKLQDYHFEYNARDSRFLEEKVHKVKALPIGPHVMLDGERCILCTRCVRFCDEVTGTSELGVLNRGDRSVIAVHPGKELNNPFSGVVVDLCPVGALTHADWRFNSRIWFTKQTDTICPGCSTGCNMRVAVRGSEVVQVKARENQAVNKEWMCDEGRYGMGRFLSKERITSAILDGKRTSIEAVLAAVSKVRGAPVAIFLSPALLLEEYTLIKQLVAKHLRGARITLAYKERSLSKLESILISPDYAANFQGAISSGVVEGNLSEHYNEMLAQLRSGAFKHVIFFGDRAIDPRDCDPALFKAIGEATVSLGVLTDADGALAAACKQVLPGRSILEKSGLMINRAGLLQYAERAVEPPTGTEPDWRLINRLASVLGGSVTNVSSERDLTLSVLGAEPKFSGITIASLKGNTSPSDGLSGQHINMTVGA